jgi:hypothetical protein
LKVTVLSFEGALSDERSGLSFVSLLLDKRAILWQCLQINMKKTPVAVAVTL